MTATWGLVATIKTDPQEAQRFAAWHLSLGAAHLWVFVDDADPATIAALRHPAITVTATDAAFWAGRRPGKHQVRQAANATRAAVLAHNLDWLAHIDVDEFLLPDTQTVAQTLGALPPEASCARIRPAEALADAGAADAGETLFKAFHIDPARRRAAGRACFGPWGDLVSGGMLSHVAGKLFVRPAAGAWDWRIHNAWCDGAENPGVVELDTLPLGHFHAPSWSAFDAKLRFRLNRGSYRSDLKPSIRSGDAPNLNTVLTRIADTEGTDGLRRFYDALNTATPTLVSALAGQGLLLRRVMDLDAHVARHFTPH